MDSRNSVAFRSSMSDDSSMAANFRVFDIGSSTVLPRPWVRSMSCLDSSSDSASRIEVLETLSCSAKERSAGRRSQGLSTPVMMSFSRWSAIWPLILRSTNLIGEMTDLLRGGSFIVETMLLLTLL